MPTYSTPGVYVEETSTLPPSVAEVATAIPAFVGYTASRAATGVEVAQVSTLLEYEERFGRSKISPFALDDQGALTTGSAGAQPEWLLWYALNLYFKNGGGRCYIVSVGDQSAPPSIAGFESGLDALEREDEPTLIVMPDLVKLSQDDFSAVCKSALAHCAKMADRFALLDVQEGWSTQSTHKAQRLEELNRSRDGYGADNLAYGAAYYPYLSTTLPHLYDEAQVKVGSGSSQRSLLDLKKTNTDLYNRARKRLDDQRVTLPPSAAIAGIYARVDRERGVWKAPANVGLQAVIAPTVAVSHEEQEDLNIRADSGKSINAIRAFAGRGPMVWGARTLAGNDNEWRYVPVRRLFIMVEESAKKASAFAVFEPNDATTWLKVRGMIESYLYGLWEQGALQGAKPEAAFYVNVGLGKTMTARDVLEGRMIVEIGLAAVRPAEFIILRFSHKLAEA